jgi:hypothetical protein
LAEEMERIKPVVELLDSEGKLLDAQEAGEEGFARYWVRVGTPHWVFV